MAPLRVSIIGLGLAVEPHAQSLLALGERIRVCHAAARSEARTQAFSARYPFPVTTDIETAIADPAVDFVMLLTPPSTHLELATACLTAGKHVLVEKPLELTVERASMLVDAAREAGKQLGAVLQHRFRRSSRRAMELIRDGALGPIQFASAAVPWWRPQSYYDEPGRGTLARDGGGVLLTQAIHTLDLFRSLVGVSEVSSAQVRTTDLHRMETEDFAAAQVRLANGAPGQIMATTAAYPGWPEEIHIVGSRGTLSIKGDQLSFDALDGRHEELGDGAATGAGEGIMDFPHDAHRMLIEDFANSVIEGREPEASGREALLSQSLVEEILEAGKKEQSGRSGAGVGPVRPRS